MRALLAAAVLLLAVAPAAAAPALPFVAQGCPECTGADLVQDLVDYFLGLVIGVIGAVPVSGEVTR